MANVYSNWAGGTVGTPVYDTCNHTVYSSAKAPGLLVKPWVYNAGRWETTRDSTGQEYWQSSTYGETKEWSTYPVYAPSNSVYVGMQFAKWYPGIGWKSVIFEYANDLKVVGCSYSSLWGNYISFTGAIASVWVN
jgi:hypothetical protein